MCSFTPLIVDDDLSLQRLLTKYLQKRGYCPLCASNGQEALHILRTTPVGVIATDIDMPVMGGEELLAELEAQNHQAPVFVMSGDRDRMARLRASERKIDAFFEKPFSLQAFGEALNKVIPPS